MTADDHGATVHGPHAFMNTSPGMPWRGLCETGRARRLRLGTRRLAGCVAKDCSLPRVRSRVGLPAACPCSPCWNVARQRTAPALCVLACVLCQRPRVWRRPNVLLFASTNDEALSRWVMIESGSEEGHAAPRPTAAFRRDLTGQLLPVASNAAFADAHSPAHKVLHKQGTPCPLPAPAPPPRSRCGRMCTD